MSVALSGAMKGEAMKAIGDAWSVKLPVILKRKVIGWVGAVAYNYGLGKPHYPVPARYHVCLDETFTDVFANVVLRGFTSRMFYSNN